MQKSPMDDAQRMMLEKFAYLDFAKDNQDFKDNYKGIPAINCRAIIMSPYGTLPPFMTVHRECVFGFNGNVKCYMKTYVVILKNKHPSFIRKSVITSRVIHRYIRCSPLKSVGCICG